MKQEAKRDEDRIRNPMTIRWTDGHFRMVADEAWKRRQSTSALVRELVLAALRGRTAAEGETKAG
jgi:hypothetical protein